MEAICKADFDRRVKAHSDAEKTFKEAKDKGKPVIGIVIPDISFYDIYGVWFFGRLKEIVHQVSLVRFDIDLGKAMHVFVDTDPKEIIDGIHDINVYGHECRLYKWMAQGYNRGLVVLLDDGVCNSEAEVYRSSGTWSWIL